MTLFSKKALAKADDSALFFMASSAIHPLPPWKLQQILLQLGAVTRSKLKPLSETGLVPGCSGLVLDVATQRQVWLTLVYPDQAQPAQGLISVLSPLGAALLGKNVAEVVTVQLFRHRLDFVLCELMSVKHAHR